MFYDFAIVVPKNTLQSSPVDPELHLTHGIIHRVEVSFPAGCAAMVHCIILHRRHQIWPENSEGSFAYDNYTIAFDEHYELKNPPYNLKAICWSPGTLYPHTIVLRIGVLPAEVLTPFAGLSGAFKKLFKLFGVGK